MGGSGNPADIDGKKRRGEEPAAGEKDAQSERIEELLREREYPDRLANPI